MDGERPVTVAAVPGLVVTFVEPWKTSYPATPRLSVEPVQVSETLFEVVLSTVSPVGAVGGVVSPLPLHGLPFSVQLAGSW